ncbi:hypothetical protein BU021_06890 [Staphylococcus simulans]|nr:hypothetical protein BU045_09235 [Staphylococcus simulans]PTJ03050.1 hypothetical protein BU046_11340 [Staphylococcus simulans]PTJ10635.1 hypothetical protein BU044_04565 [Staphylococcus simulans]PTJ40292.1 hypothetical protein BU021_06890 [Staphylococcus simulans]PTJ95838.1 hypothetical protein BU013_09910 [Staphylococcus simulans]
MAQYKETVPYQKERVMNGYVLLLFSIIIIMNRLLTYALTEDLKQTLLSYFFFIQIMCLVTYTAILFRLKDKKEIRGLR